MFGIIHVKAMEYFCGFFWKLLGLGFPLSRTRLPCLHKSWTIQMKFWLLWSSRVNCSWRQWEGGGETLFSPSLYFLPALGARAGMWQHQKSPWLGAAVWGGQQQPGRLPPSAAPGLGKGCAEEPRVRQTEPVWHTAALRSALNAEDNPKMFISADLPRRTVIVHNWNGVVFTV